MLTVSVESTSRTAPSRTAKTSFRAAKRVDRTTRYYTPYKQPPGSYTLLRFYNTPPPPQPHHDTCENCNTQSTDTPDTSVHSCRGWQTESSVSPHHAHDYPSSLFKAPPSQAQTDAAAMQQAASLQQVASLEEEIAQLQLRVGRVAEAVSEASEVVVTTAPGLAPYLSCSFCSLPIASNPFCAQFGTLHITEKECRRRVDEAKDTFRFRSDILRAKPTIAYVLHFWAFYDILGATRDARDDAQTWLFQHHIRYTHPITQQSKSLAVEADECTATFERFCTTRWHQEDLARQWYPNTRGW